MAAAIFSLIEFVPALRDLFFSVQSLIYDKIFEDLSIETTERKRKRRAISRAISKAENDEDRKALSIMLADLYRIVPTNSDRDDIG